MGFKALQDIETLMGRTGLGFCTKNETFSSLVRLGWTVSIPITIGYDIDTL